MSNPTFVQSNSASGGATSQNCLMGTTTIGNLLIAVVADFTAGATTLGITDSAGNVWNPVSAQQGPAGGLNYQVRAWWAIAKSSVSSTAQATSSSGVFIEVFVAEYTWPTANVFVDQSLPISALTGSANMPGLSFTVATSGELLFVTGASQAASSPSVNSPFTKRNALATTQLIADDIGDSGSPSFSGSWGTSTNSADYGFSLYSTAIAGSTVYSVPDCRVPPAGPNANRTVNATKIYDVQTSSNPAIPPTDSRVAPNIPVDSRLAANIPQNSRTPGTYGPGVN